MPESDTEHVDYYPAGWTEKIHDESCIEWIYKTDPRIFVRLEETIGDAYIIIPIIDVDTSEGEFILEPVSRLTREEAFDTAISLVYSMNGILHRFSARVEFTVSNHQSQEGD